MSQDESLMVEHNDILIYLKEHFNLSSKKEVLEKSPYVIKVLLQSDELQLIHDKEGAVFSPLKKSETLETAFKDWINNDN
jgi:hypothetical protein